MRNKTRFKVFLTIFAMTMLCSTLVFAAEDAAAVNSAKFGMWTVLPPLVSIVLAFLTKNVVVSLFIGTMTGCIMLQLNGFNIITALTQGFIDFTYRALNSLADPWNAGIILQVLVIGGVIHLVAKMGGAKAIAEALARKAKTVKSAQLTTWLLGLAVFFDDYANSLIVGPIMRPVTDKLGKDVRYYITEYIKEKKVLTPRCRNDWKVIPEAWFQAGKKQDYKIIYESH